ncbi:MAG: 8-oxo-dGTP diphosphatase MutT [Verrucomicrobiales bacterium]|nr:8-oxo-dGTP diphosphatase MutT [Verrucomicrobiales bacterium]
MADKPVEVAAGLVFRNGKLLITKRQKGSHLAGLWEFPGGKRESGETVEECLRRELREELGIQIAVGQALETVTHRYPEKTVQITFFTCRLTKGEPSAIECADLVWSERESLAKFDFPPADQRLISRLVDEPSLWE